eukprot:TRINITY_DN9653_c0_g1_i4.p1 TRINITY_DN9653_c0_g1~~TRINITY_DN9653_c0_g1_i4.p1  ORF type:complete len:327 (+),score=39.78 TRINITY_DN9653_c0_g1_i4:279-1259(+)
MRSYLVEAWCLAAALEVASGIDHANCNGLTGQEGGVCCDKRCLVCGISSMSLANVCRDPNPSYPEFINLKASCCGAEILGSGIYCSDAGGEPPCILFPKDLTCPQGQDSCGHENNSQHPPSTSSGLSVSAYESLDFDVVCCAPDERCMAYGDQYGDTWTQCDKACTDDICQGTGDDPGPVVHGHCDPAYYNGINYMPAGEGNPDNGKCACAKGFHGIYCDAAACFNRQSDVQGCSGHGACTWKPDPTAATADEGVYECECHKGWRPPHCAHKVHKVGPAFYSSLTCSWCPSSMWGTTTSTTSDTDTAAPSASPSAAPTASPAGRVA